MIGSMFWYLWQMAVRTMKPVDPPHVFISSEQLQAAMPFVTSANVFKYILPLRHTLGRHTIVTPMRIAHFLAQVGHESGSFRYLEEIASGKNYDTGRKAIALGNTPEQDGDGQKYKGRGAIQLTGRANYEAYGDSIGVNLIASPERVANDPELYIDCAGWFWERNKLNTYADKDDIVSITRIINGGLNGLVDRKMRLLAAKKVLRVT